MRIEGKMKRDNFVELSDDYYRIEKIIHYIEKHYQEQPDLGELASVVNLSEFHFQRMFRRWVGVSPKRFLQYITKEYAKAMLEERSGLLETTYQTGLSSPGRLHDLFITCEATTPGEYRRRGEGLSIRFGIHPSPFGNCLLALTDRGICGMVFLPEANYAGVVDQWLRRWKNATIREDVPETGQFIERVFSEEDTSVNSPLPVYLQGTNFQIKVWEALIMIPTGSVINYQDIAYRIGVPGAARAVGNAISSNALPVIIPCHRVIRKSGMIGKYRWGAARKKAILGYEFARSERTMEMNDEIQF